MRLGLLEFATVCFLAGSRRPFPGSSAGWLAPHAGVIFLLARSDFWLAPLIPCHCPSPPPRPIIGWLARPARWRRKRLQALTNGAGVISARFLAGSQSSRANCKHLTLTLCAWLAPSAFDGALCISRQGVPLPGLSCRWTSAPGSRQLLMYGPKKLTTALGSQQGSVDVCARFAPSAGAQARASQPSRRGPNHIASPR